MVVIGTFQSEEKEEQAIRLVGRDFYQEKVGPNETLVSVRAGNMVQAHRLSGLLSRAGAQCVEIDAEAA